MLIDSRNNEIAEHEKKIKAMKIALEDKSSK
jgi:hypothetical protein